MSNPNIKGRWKPGESGNPKGRPPKAVEEGVMRAIAETLTPQDIAGALRSALEIATKQQSARGIIAVLTLASSYAIGKPLQRVEVGNNNAMEEALARVAMMRGGPVLIDDSGAAGEEGDL